MDCQYAVQLMCTEFLEETPAFIIKIGMEAGGFSETSAHIYQTTLCYLHSSGMLCSVEW